ncbi:erythromycin esterase family protein [Actinomadura rubrisoli]|uniref:Erythromycin esterase family protein n=1 Tax=Actinomadura rubrisoli TaxID=2530368 RepID=A0A4R5ARD1_9ACTN|nr:erythromycin esterase family protein [Actinomadura rubrisoli]TDD74246.1 erythromycin esterase family protein [Actinomadura rubrisoli]
MTAAIEDAAHAVAPASVMGLLPARPRLLGLGEPAHGEDVLLRLRNDLFRRLVEQEGYRTITIESDCMRGLVVDDYVTSGSGVLDDVMERGFSHGWFNVSAANRELVRWMRAHNDGRPAAEHVRFAGFDGPLEITDAASPRQALTALHACLADRVDADLLPCTAETLDRLLGADDRWSDPAAMTDPSRSVGRTPDARRLRLLADDLVALLDARTPDLIAASRDGWHRARLYGRTATGLLRYHFWMADPSPGRMARLLDLRASMMAANLLALAERGPTLVHAHNGHLQRGKSTMRMGGRPLEWWGAGAIVSARLGEGYAFLATALGAIGHRGVEAPPPDTVEGLLYALPGDRYVVDARRLAAVLGEAPPAPRVSPWFGYSPLDPDQVAGHDGIVFVKDVRPG